MLLHKCYDKLITLLILFMVLKVEWVLKFRIWVLTVIIGTYVYGILVIDGYLCSFRDTVDHFRYVLDFELLEAMTLICKVPMTLFRRAQHSSLGETLQA